MMHKIMDGDIRLATPIYQIYRHVACDVILAWMIANKITGKQFAGVLAVEHNNSIVLFMAHAIKKITLDVKMRPIICGKDWFPG